MYNIAVFCRFWYCSWCFRFRREYSNFIMTDPLTSLSQNCAEDFKTLNIFRPFLWQLPLCWFALNTGILEQVHKIVSPLYFRRNRHRYKKDKFFKISTAFEKNMISFSKYLFFCIQIFMLKCKKTFLHKKYIQGNFVDKLSFSAKKTNRI